MIRNCCLTTLILLFLFFPANAQAPKLTRGPYLQVVTPTSVIVRWSTDQPTRGRAWFGLSANQLANDVRETEATLDHSLTLTGMNPATKYLYAIGYDDTQLVSGPDYYVKTVVPAGDKRPVRFWVLGDFGSNNENQKKVYEAYRHVTATHPADLWLWLGDNAYSFGLEQEYQEYVFNVYPPTLRNTPIFPTPGNHDYADSYTNFNIPYYKLFAFPEKGDSGGVPSGKKSYFSADYGNVHLISLDSQANQDDGFRLYDTTSTQVKWLKRDLEANKLPWTIVIFHHPPYSKGGHNSDTEVQLKLLRENLTPILERYGVDLVLNGHSHGYERTYRLKGMRGLANTFDREKNIAEQTTARYDGSANSCPILTKGEGTVYIVNGSGGQLGGQSADFPHPGTVYNNVTLGGSMILDVNDNRLDAQLVMADKSVLDRFTILKKVNNSTSLNALYGDTLQLAASWPGEYRWPDGQTSRSIQYVVGQVGTFPITVKDDKNCLADVFQLTIAQPKLTTRTSTSACVGGNLTVSATFENAKKADDWQYDVLLSDASGDFAKEQIVGSGKISDLKAAIPTNLPAGSGYRLRVRPRNVPTELVSSEPVMIKPLPTATLAGSTTVTPGSSVSLSIAFTGDAPWKGNLSDGTNFSGSANPLIVTVKPTKSTTYSVSSVENGCGKGTSAGQADVTILVPTAEEELVGGKLRIYPNPAHDVVNVELTLAQKQEVSVRVLDTQGRSLFQKHAGQIVSLVESIPMPTVHGTYLLKIQVGESTITRKVVRQ
ncbi:metallophosphoesterase [Spirosoma sp.]|uniref:metallophosphoesterase n=1 Tax=Spirosoma sp. TaxID=1899569 RepID=UPI003B3B57CE